MTRQLRRQLARSARAALAVCVSALVLTSGASRAEGTPEVALSLDDCLRMALQNSPELVQKRLDHEIAGTRELQAYSYLLPRVKATPQMVSQTPIVNFDDDFGSLLGSYSQLSGGFGTGGGPGSNIPSPNVPSITGFPSEITTAGLVMNMPLLAGGKIWNGIALANLNAKLEKSLLLETGYRTAYRVRQLYLGILVGQSSVALLDEMQRELARIVEDTRRLQEKGFVTNADVLEAKANLANLTAKRAEAVANVTAAKEALRLVMGLDGGQPYRLTDELKKLPAPTVASLGEVEASALSSRPELDSRRLQLKLAERQVWLRRGDLPFVPTLGVQLEGGYRGLAIPIVQTNWSKTFGPYYQAAIALEVPLFDGLESYARVDEAKLTAKKAELGVRQTEAMVSLEVRQHHAALAARLTALEVSEQVVSARAERFRVAEKNFELGTLGRAEYLAEHLKWAEARASRVNALYQVHLAALELDAASGQLPKTVDAVGGAP